MFIQQFYFIMSTHQQMQRSFKRPLESAQSRLALLSHLTQKKQGNSQFKKKSFFWDQEYLYSQNLMLRSQIKQLTQANTKAKTRILQMEQQLKNKNNRNNDQDYKQTVLRSMSLRHLSKKSLTFVRSNQDQQASSKPVRTIIRQLKEQIQLVKNENTELKRSMKYTRMSELQTINKQMQIQMQRLHRLTHDMKDKYYAITIQFEVLRQQYRREVDAKVMAVKEKDKLKREIIHLRNQYKQLTRKRPIQFKPIQQYSKNHNLNPQAKVGSNMLKDNPKIDGVSFKSFPKLEYSISGIEKVENDTINFDKLINTDTELKSIPKIASITSLQLQKQSTKNEPEEQYGFESQQQEQSKQIQHKQATKSQQSQIKKQEHMELQLNQAISPIKQKQQEKAILQVQQAPSQDQVYEDLMQQQFEQ